MKMTLLYFGLGILFTYMAINSITDTIWNVTTILLLIVAALDFGVGFRYLRTTLTKKKEN